MTQINSHDHGNIAYPQMSPILQIGNSSNSNLTAGAEKPMDAATMAASMIADS